MSYKDLKIGDVKGGVINCVIEIPKGTRNKYEYDEKLDLIVLDRVVHSSVVYPVNYGYIPETRAEDGDHLDVLVLCHDALFPGCVVKVRPIGILRMTDDKGPDSKIVAVIVDDMKSETKKDITDIDDGLKREIAHFFEIYKQLEGKKVTVDGYGDLKAAMLEIEKTMEA
jgi:inorganic pyrophosphatase